jgi:tetrahydromethanopterin S-methyltransferase subunit A
MEPEKLINLEKCRVGRFDQQVSLLDQLDLDIKDNSKIPASTFARHPNRHALRR